MSDDMVWKIIISVITFVATAAVIWGGIRGKIEAIGGRIDTLEDTFHRRINQTCSTCRDNTMRVEHSVTEAHQRIDKFMEHMS